MVTYNPYAFRSYTMNKEISASKAEVASTIKSKAVNWNKFIIATLLVVIVVMSFFLIRVTASSPNSEIAVEGEIKTYVGSGDTLWDIAKRHYTEATDIGYIVYLIMERNNLSTSTIIPGQQLILPTTS